MNTMRRWIDYWNRKVKRFGILEVKLAQGAAAAFALIIAKLFPQILMLSVWWFVALLVVCAAPVWHTLWFKTDGPVGAAPDGDAATPPGK